MNPCLSRCAQNVCLLLQKLSLPFTLQSLNIDIQIPRASAISIMRNPTKLKSQRSTGQNCFFFLTVSIPKYNIMKTRQFRFSTTTLEFDRGNFEKFLIYVSLYYKDTIVQNRYLTSLSKVFNHSISSTIYRHRWPAE